MGKFWWNLLLALAIAFCGLAYKGTLTDIPTCARTWPKGSTGLDFTIQQVINLRWEHLFADLVIMAGFASAVVLCFYFVFIRGRRSCSEIFCC
ncbi:MAG: hypothetical protein Q7S36_03770 [Candidatus Liptonbacteria bacterium]|nr:hypothetical protein [Candidatus Liptonbacteria bacterium]